MRGSAALLALLCSAVPAVARDAEPIARARLEPSTGRVTVGQPVEVVVEVLVPNFFTGAPRFPHLDVRDALTIFEDRGVNFTEPIGGETWAGQSRTYVIYPQRPGRYEIESIPVETRFRGPGGPVAASASPPPLAFEAALPPGAENPGYFIAATKLELARTVEPEPDTLRVGDAIVVTTTVTVNDALSMVVPPQPPAEIPGLRAYADPPVVRDEGGERGERIVGTRIETVTWVAEEPGTYRVPPAELVWWDVAEERTRTSSTTAVELVVVPAPATEPAIAPPPEEPDEPESAAASSRSLLRELRRRLPGVAIAAIVVWLAVRFVRARIPRWRRAAQERTLRRDESEETYFGRFARAARSGEPADARWALAAWIDRTGFGPSAREVAVRCGDGAFVAELDALDARLFGRAPARGPWSGRELAEGARRLRARLRETSRPGAGALAASLNPRGEAWP